MKQVANICKKWHFLTLLGLTNILMQFLQSLFLIRISVFYSACVSVSEPSVSPSR